MSEVISNEQGKQWLTQLLKRLELRREQLDRKIQELVKQLEVAEEHYEKDIAAFSILSNSRMRIASGELNLDVVQNCITVSENIVKTGQECLAMREAHNNLMFEFQQVEAKIAMTRQFLEQNFDDLPELPQEDIRPKKHRLIDEVFCALMEEFPVFPNSTVRNAGDLSQIRQVLHNWGLTYWTPEKLAKALDNQFNRKTEKLLFKIYLEGRNYWSLSEEGKAYYQRNLRALHKKLLENQ